jgi:hypothetical protein
MKKKNPLSEHFQNRIEKSSKEAKSTSIPLTYKYKIAHFPGLVQIFNKNGGVKTSFMDPSHNVVHLALIEFRTHNIIGDRHLLHR